MKILKEYIKYVCEQEDEEEEFEITEKQFFELRDIFFDWVSEQNNNVERFSENTIREQIGSQWLASIAKGLNPEVSHRYLLYIDFNHSFQQIPNAQVDFELINERQKGGRVEKETLVFIDIVSSDMRFVNSVEEFLDMLKSVYKHFIIYGHKLRKNIKTKT